MAELSGYAYETTPNKAILAGKTSGANWEYLTGGVTSTPAVAYDAVCVGLSDYSVYALKQANRTLLWKYTTKLFVQTSPAVANGVVYITSADANIYALNANNGSLLWSYNFGSRSGSSAAIANGMAYIGAEDGNIYAFRL